MEEEPITPITGPILDLDGQLTYLGEDGQRYVVLDSLKLDQESSLRVADLLRGAEPLFVQIETLCHRWMDQVCRGVPDREEAVSLLLASLESVLDEEPHPGGDASGS